MDRGVNFEGFRFELVSGRLWSGDREVRLTPKAADVLKLLVARAGTPVSKDELFATVWSGTAVSDDALTSCIQELRRSLADDSKQPRFIETRHRRGYQFIARLIVPTAGTEPQPAAPPSELSAIAVLPFADMTVKHLSLGQSIQDLKPTARSGDEARKAETAANHDLDDRR